MGQSVAVRKPVPGQLPGICPCQPSAKEPWNRSSWNPDLLAPEQLPLIPELLVEGSGPGEKTRHIV